MTTLFRSLLVSRVFVSFALCAALVSGCAKPRQLGGSIAINEAGLGGRVDAFCHLNAPDAPKEDARKACLGEPLE